MLNETAQGLDRRTFLRYGATLGAASLSSTPALSLAAEPPPEVTRLPIHQNRLTCIAPQIIAEQLLNELKRS